MKWPFGIGKAKTVVPITSILIPQSVHDSAKPHDLPMAVVDLVNALTGQAQYRSDEIPWEALFSYRVDYYLAQVNNGGHAQFVGNSGWEEAVIIDIRDGLDAMGLDDALAVFEGLMLFASDHPDRFVAAAEGGGFGDIDPIIKDLDDRFFAGPSEQILIGNDQWLRAKAPLEIVPDREYQARLTTLMNANPIRNQRLAEAERNAREARDRDPLTHAFSYIIAQLRPRPEYQGWSLGRPMIADTGEQGMSFLLANDGLTITAAVYPTTTIVSRLGQASALLRISTPSIEAHVRKRTREPFPDIWPTR